jgi:hypothetical protein
MNKWIEPPGFTGGFLFLKDSKVEAYSAFVKSLSKRPKLLISQKMELSLQRAEFSPPMFDKMDIPGTKFDSFSEKNICST